MKMANEYDDVCVVHELIVWVLYLQKIPTVFCCASNIYGRRDILWKVKTFCRKYEVITEWKDATTVLCVLLMHFLKLFAAMTNSGSYSPNIIFVLPDGADNSYFSIRNKSGISKIRHVDRIILHFKAFLWAFLSLPLPVPWQSKNICQMPGFLNGNQKFDYLDSKVVHYFLPNFINFSPTMYGVAPQLRKLFYSVSSSN